jgi:ribonuclease-3
MSQEMSQFLSYQFKNTDMLEQALTHKSFVNESGRKHLVHNEKLEFLGDAVLDLILSEYLMEIYPTDDEGDLSKKRASLVNETILAQIAQALELSERLRLGKGEVLSNGKQKPRLLASAFEALLGAVFLDGGYESVRQVVRESYKNLLTQMNPTESFEQDYKTRLQEISQADLREMPAYEVTGEEGPSHNPQFEVTLTLQAQVVSKGLGRSKKNAEQDAAKRALELWKQLLEAGTLRRPNV